MKENQTAGIVPLAFRYLVELVMKGMRNVGIYIHEQCLYYKHIMIVNDDSRFIRMMLQVVALSTINILMTLEVSFTLLENIYGTGITDDDHCMMIFTIQAIIHLKYHQEMVCN
jgi:hypothetical protein